ncbi:MAG TPA: anthranilate synthase component I family protein [Cellvibrio sp.]|nr:anthranilate synthase component I family protein [Cellvibrio sp.]
MYSRLTNKSDLIACFKDDELSRRDFYVIYQKHEYQVIGLLPQRIYQFHHDLNALDLYQRISPDDYSRECVLLDGQDPVAYLNGELVDFGGKVASHDTPFFRGGLIGAASFEGLSQLLDIEITDAAVPPLVFGMFDTYMVKNMTSHELHVVCADSNRTHISAFLEKLTQTDYQNVFASDQVLTPFADFYRNASQNQNGRENFYKQVDIIKDNLRKGNSFQTVLSHKYHRVQQSSPLDTFSKLYRHHSTYKFLAKFFDIYIAGISPENLFVLDQQGGVRMTPLAGTRALTEDPLVNKANEEELLSSEKENAEHTMLVDLARNDLGMVCEDGSVVVERYRYIEYCKDVMHLATDVTGKLAADKTALDLMRAASPAGTMSGAPKIRSINIIQEVEGDARGFYSGNIGFVNLDGSADFSIIIRSVTFAGDRVQLRAGAGIVLDSVAEDEYEECLRKMYSCGKEIA